MLDILKQSLLQARPVRPLPDEDSSLGTLPKDITNFLPHIVRYRSGMANISFWCLALWPNGGVHLVYYMQGSNYSVMCRLVDVFYCCTG